jgi:hypothetical protein
MAIRSTSTGRARSQLTGGAGAPPLAFALAVASTIALGAGAAAAQTGPVRPGDPGRARPEGARPAGAAARAEAPAGAEPKAREAAAGGRARSTRDAGVGASPRARNAGPAADPGARDAAKADGGERGAPSVRADGGERGVPSARADGGERSAPSARVDAGEAGAAAPAKSRRGKSARRERAADPTCLRDRVEVGRATGEVDNFPLVRCDGRPAEGAAERLAVLLRPYSAPKPALPAKPPAEARGREWAPGVRSADPGLLTRLQAFADRYRGKRIVVVSGYRPASVGSYHKDARAIDLRVEGVRNEELVAFCRGLRDTGCGYYPNSSFVHVDVRPAGTGHVYWIDASGPGEAPRYVSSWPPPRDEPLLDRPARPEEAAPRDEHTHADVAGRRPGRGIGATDRSDEASDGPPPLAPPAPHNVPPRQLPAKPPAADDADRLPPLLDGERTDET